MYYKPKSETATLKNKPEQGGRKDHHPYSSDFLCEY